MPICKFSGIVAYQNLLHHGIGASFGIMLNEAEKMTRNLPVTDDPDVPSLGLAPYACKSAQSHGRIYDEPESRTRNAFARDRDRIIHSAAFRRLKYKTQVFVYHEGDNYRTRLSHSIEVAQIARSMARSLGCHEDLAEAVALAHDLGHTPFAHVGEDVLDECLERYGGFDHNDQSLRVLTRLEKRYLDFDGLNLTWETLEGVVKHNGPVLVDGKTIKDMPDTIREVSENFDLRLDSFASVEAQIAALSDDIAYNNHDIDDGIRADFFTLDDLEGLPLVGDIVRDVRRKHPNLTKGRLKHEIIRELIGHMMADVLEETRKRLAALDPQSPDDVRNAKQRVVAFSDEMKAVDKQLREFLYENMYREYRVNRMRRKVANIVRELYELLMDYPQCLPKDWQEDIANHGDHDPEYWRSRVITDYIAGMTDRYALLEHQRMFDPYRDIK